MNKVTIDITREQAEGKALEAYIRIHRDKLRDHIETMTNSQLEKYIDELFYNFVIIDDKKET